MIVEQLQLVDFRNYTSAAFDLTPGVTAIVGRNAQGKTNVAEAMAFAKAEGLPLPEVIDTLGKGAGSSWYFVNRAPNMVTNRYPAGFRVQLHAKDLRICQAMAARHGVQLPVVDTTLSQYAELVSQGHADDDISSLFVLKDALFRE